MLFPITTTADDERIVKQSDVSGPAGAFEISTIWTKNQNGKACAFDEYEDENPWPLETMVFRSGSRIGLYHAPHGTHEEAVKHHALMVYTIENGLEFAGGVEGPMGTPCQSTIAEWKARVPA